MNRFTPRRHSPLQGSSTALRWGSWLPWLALTLLVLLAGLVALQGSRAASRIRERDLEENRLLMRSSEEHASDYLEEIYSMLLFVSGNKEVVALREEAREFVQKVYDHAWENHQLAEIYVIERDFRGTGRPFLTFERESAARTAAAIHSPAREVEEHRAQMDHIRRFQLEPALRALLSEEVRLCVPGAGKDRARGFVYSVPIRNGEELVGIVSGMIRTEVIRERLHQGHDRQIAVLLSDRGDLVPDAGADSVAVAEIRRLLVSRDGARLAEDAREFSLGSWTALSMPAEILSGEPWELLFLSKKADPAEGGDLFGAAWYHLLAASLLATGFALALLLRSMFGRLAEQKRFLKERKELERQVQEASEREQRRIGEALREDLCQRLTGVEAVACALERRLQNLEPSAISIASEIVGEITAAIACAREMAEDLQPVSLLEDGFLAAIHELADRTERRSRAACRVETSGWPEHLEISFATHLYRIAQEAVANAVEHSHAREVIIGLAADERRLTLAIRDDGIGLPRGSAPVPGTGLRIMAYRSELIGADLEIGAAPGKGTLVTCVVPHCGSGAGCA